jgi:alcohol dehydrogenase (cytochrome c)
VLLSTTIIALIALPHHSISAQHGEFTEEQTRGGVAASPQQPATPSPARPAPPVAAQQATPPPAPPAAAVPVNAPMPAILQNYQPVTAQRLLNPEPSNWLQIRGTWDGWAYSQLDQITPRNVKQLQPAWVFGTGAVAAHEAVPLVNNGVMYVSANGNQVIAIDAKAGAVLWRYRKALPEGVISMHPVTRGVALYGDKVFFASNAAVLIALDAKTGREIWSTEVDDNKKGYYLTGAPLIADGKVVIGTAGGEFGIRGWVAAYDPDTGKQAWRCFTVPAPGEPGSETWPAGDVWKTGGGSTWVTGNYDPKTNLIFWGVGNGGPWMGDLRPGDNLYLSSTIAIDAANGKIVGYQQYDPNESFDWDEVSPPLLIDYKRGGKTITGLVNFARDGYVFFLERTTGKINFVDAQPYVYQNVFKRVDPKTGKIEYDPDHKPTSGKSTEICPMWLGAKNWQPAAFSPKTRLIYVPTSANLCSTLAGQGPMTYRQGMTFMGGRNTLFIRPGADHVGEVQAWNVDTAKKVWTHNFKDSTNWGGILATAGGLIFSGGTADRMFRAYDASTGEVLWEFPTQSGIEAPPSTFMVDGRQYVAVLSGWGGDARGIQAQLNRIRPGQNPEVPDGGAIWVFALPQTASKPTTANTAPTAPSAQATPTARSGAGR